MAYFFAIVEVGNVLLERTSRELKTQLPVTWLYKCEGNENEQLAPYWPQNHNARERCLNHACVPPTSMPTRIQFDVSGWGIEPFLELPEPFLTPTDAIILGEFERTPTEITWQGIDEYKQDWIVTIENLANTVRTPIDVNKWTLQSFAGKLSIVIRDGGAECQLIRYVGILSGSVPIASIEPNPSNFRRVPSEPGSRPRWEVQWVLYTEPLDTPCNKEGTGAAPYFWKQVPGFPVRSVDQWAKYRTGQGSILPLTLDPSVIGKCSSTGRLMPLRDYWAVFLRTFCLDVRQFPGGTFALTQRMRLRNALPIILTPEIYGAAPFINRFCVMIGDQQPTILNDPFTLLSIVVSFQNGGILNFTATDWRGEFVASMNGADFEGGFVEFSIEARLIEVLPPTVPKTYGLAYTLVHLGIRTPIPNPVNQTRVGVPIGIGWVVLDSRVPEWDGDVNDVVFDPASTIILQNGFPTVQLYPLTIGP